MAYPHREIEQKWQQRWDASGLHKTRAEDGRPSCYVLEMFPYPSGRLHMGHVRNYMIGDALGRYKRAAGFNVLHPLGWDAFGLPAENAAIQNNVAPGKWTYENIAAMRTQFKKLGVAVDWDLELATCDASYYQYEQKFFIEFFKKGLAYQKESWVNWDPVDQCVLANEQVVNGKGWRSGAPVQKRRLRQWFLKITDFADDLLKSLESLTEWPEQVRVMQHNWIGRSEGALVRFDLAAPLEMAGQIFSNIEVFTTRPETLYGASFCAIAANHPIAEAIRGTNPDVDAFIRKVDALGTAEETREAGEKEGVATGLYVRHPFDPAWEIPVYVANYVLMEYGTGAVFGCPAHDQRDLDLARKYHLPVRPVIQPDDWPAAQPFEVFEEAYTGPGHMINSAFLDGLSIEQAFKACMTRLEEDHMGERLVTYRLHDWGVSRQRYWGCPIPMIYCPGCGTVPVPEKDLPVVLPQDAAFDGMGNPLERHPTWKFTTCPQCGQAAERETDTFDTFMESSWYFLRFCSPHAQDAFNAADVKKWMPVNHYIGGIEHAVMHLLYSRFFMRALRAIGYDVPKEPFQQLLTQGMVCHESYQTAEGGWLFPEEVEKGKDGKCHSRATGQPVRVLPPEKMSKSHKNVVDPDAMIEAYGVDAVRLFSLSDTPVERDLIWSEEGLHGAWRFIGRVWTWAQKEIQDGLGKAIVPTHLSVEEVPEPARALRQTIHKTIKIVTDDYAAMRYNTAIARFRVLFSALQGFAPKSELDKGIVLEGLKVLCQMLGPITPHLAAEIWQGLGRPDALLDAPWPAFEEAWTQDSQVTIAVQVSGKLRGTFDTSPETSEEALIQIALSLPRIQEILGGQQPRKVIVVQGRVVNVVL